MARTVFEEVHKVAVELGRQDVSPELYSQVFQKIADALEGVPIAVGTQVCQAMVNEAAYQELLRRDLGGSDELFADELQPTEDVVTVSEKV